MLQAKLDELGKAGWLAIVLVAAWAAWPIALLMLAHLAASGRLRAWWHPWEDFRFDPRVAVAGLLRRGWAMSSGNRAFDEHRAEALRHLDEEGREFRAYLERLRRTRGEAEFDDFMAERRERPDAPQPAGVDREGPAASARPGRTPG